MMDFAINEIDGRYVATKIIPDYIFVERRIPMEYVWEDLRRKMAEAIYTRVAKSGQHVVVKLSEKITPSITGDEHEMTVSADLAPVQYQDVIMPSYKEVGWINGNKKCAYCGSISPDDSRGNCLACGSPRSG